MPKRILFIDDEPEFVRAHIDTLSDAGYDVEHAATYTEALDRLNQQQFDLIILDLILPPGETDERYYVSEPSGEVGLELHLVIRKELQLTKVPIIFFTVINEVETHHEIRETESKFGATPVILVKPNLPSKLLIQVRKLVGGSDG